MHLDLNDDEHALLRDVLSAAFRDLRMEVTKTDNAAYRHALQQRESIMGSILEKVGGLLDLP